VRVLGRFFADRGAYALDLDIADDLSRLNNHRPELLIYEDGGEYLRTADQGAAALIALLLFGPIGLCTMMSASMVRRDERRFQFAREFSLTHPGCLNSRGLPLLLRARPQKPKRPSQWAFLRTSWFGLIAAQTWIILAIVIFAIKAAAYVPIRGLRIRVNRPEITMRVPGIQPMRIRLERAAGHRPNIYIDSQLTSWDGFASDLQKGLNVRPPAWPIYLESDADIDWGYAVETIDAIHGLHAEVILLAPTKTAGR